jgi:DNA-binding transcriptional LysR family regulator
MNVRHLELFHHVARNRGISRAIGHMPYSIQQPALSEQILALEHSLGTKLFHRQPFRLTPDGHELFKATRVMFEHLDRVDERLRHRNQPHFRVAADEMMTQQYAGPVLQSMRALMPEVLFTFHSGAPGRMQHWLREGEIDLAITTTDGDRPHGLACRRLATRSLVLVIAKRKAIRSANDFWIQPKIVDPLISPCATDGISQVFQRGLKRGDIEWTPQIVASSAGSVAPCVASGAGVGVTLGVPYLVRHPKVRTLQLVGFERVEIAALWRPEDTARLKPLLATIRACVVERI